LDTIGLAGGLMATFRQWDQAGNAAPSLHAALALVTTMAGMRRWPRPVVYVLATCWLVAVLWSCVALRQHTAVDLLLGLAVAALCDRIARRQPEVP
jgi:membrane-associated phospholipid phosphatase